MKITSEQKLRYFDFWGGAKERVKLLSYEELDIIEMELEIMYYPEGLTETQLNDIFWFDDEFIAEILGYESFEDIIEERRHEK